MAGRYEGDLVVTLLDDGRRVKLMNDFAYIDGANLRWDTPKDAIVDGASIPKVLWGLTGGPFEGKYRNASVIHDWYCDQRSRKWQAVHRVFYEAMLTSGVPEIQARYMYAAVRWAGPKWSATVVHNAEVATKPHPMGFGAGAGTTKGKAARTGKAKRRITTTHTPLNKTQFEALTKRVKSEDLSLDDIDRMVDDKTAKLKSKVLSVKDED
ncbi:MAG TPA: DUF1353 domain-containing protein [Phenylobacterium sp.]|nr:DUF1353 domain-containing protein [Phenylobacterium sp.]